MKENCDSCMSTIDGIQICGYTINMGRVNLIFFRFSRDHALTYVDNKDFQNEKIFFYTMYFQMIHISKTETT